MEERMFRGVTETTRIKKWLIKLLLSMQQNKKSLALSDIKQIVAYFATRLKLISKP